VADAVIGVPVFYHYYEACRCAADAIHRERHLKSTCGHRYLRNRLKHDFDNAA
jgi:hypothetical protein